LREIDVAAKDGASVDSFVARVVQVTQKGEDAIHERRHPKTVGLDAPRQIVVDIPPVAGAR
jgi:hypothetical protein